MNELQERSNELLQEEIRKVKERLNKFAFPCPHCNGKINDEHFGTDKRAFAYIKELGGKIVEEEIISRWTNYRGTILEEIKSRKIYEEFPAFKELREVIKKDEENLKYYERKISELNSAEHIENLTIVKRLQGEKKELDNKYTKKVEDLQSQNQDLQRQILAKQEQIQNLVLRQKGQGKGQDLEKWFYEELVKVFDGQDRIMDVSKGQSGVGKRADFLQEVLIETEPEKTCVGRIVYETKNTEKWDNGWIEKLEKDMVFHRADYGFIVATCEGDKIVRSVKTIDPRKKIYISGDNINLFLAIKIIRELLITKHSLMKSDESVDKEQKLKKIEDWSKDKLPKYIIDLQKNLENQESAANAIIDKANKIKKFKDEIYRLTMININEELKKHLT